ncbi:MAG TPA: SpoIID/LytB domain-containing protein [Acidimicrobiales bacterium]|nr:SpoIID/LytB domain-containing protein [Acidimicrobiales bacterium]
MLAAGLLVAAGAGPAAAYPYPDVSLTGHGWGHGHGMGQWGALGDALGGMTYPQILTTFYGSLAAGGSTTLGPLPNGWHDSSTTVTVAITENAGNDVIVTSGSPFAVPAASQTVPAGGGARFVLTDPVNNRWSVYVAPSQGCAGGPAAWGPPVATNVAAPQAVPGAEPFPSDGNLVGEVLDLCQLGGNIALRGTVGGTMSSAGQARTVDVVPLGEYVADVTPSESPVSWGSLGAPGSQGAPLGFQELEAQAVAVRSYVMSTYGSLQGWFGYADVCDSTCQSYPGIANENSLTDTATTDTADTAVLLPGGAPATTQYSSSTGGYTAGGTFAAVPDSGDAVCVPGACNTHHAWQAHVPVTAIESAYPQLGALESVGVTQRNGLGDLGGRVTQMALVGNAQTVTLSGDTFAAQFASFGVQSDWFALTSQASGGVGGYWLLGSDGGVFSFGDASFHGSMGGTRLNAPMVGMAATPDGGGYWTVASDGGVFSFGDAPYEGSLPGDAVTGHAVALRPTRTGMGYLVVAVDGRAVAFGDAPQFSDVASSVAGWRGSLVDAAQTS